MKSYYFSYGKNISKWTAICVSLISISSFARTPTTNNIFDPSYKEFQQPLIQENPNFQPLETVSTKAPAEIETSDLTEAQQMTLVPALISSGTTLKTPQQITQSVRYSVIDPRFGRIEAPIQRLNSSGQLVAAPNARLNPSAVDLMVLSADNPNPLVMPSVSSILEPTVPSVIAPTIANGGIVQGSRLSMAIAPTANPFSEIPVMTATTRSTQEALKLNIQASCFPTNLRSVANPVSPNATLILKGKYSISGNPNISNKDFSVRFPASAVMMGTGANLTLATTDYNFDTFPNAITGGVSGNLVSVNLPSVSNASLDVNTGTIQQAHSSFQISDLRFEQEVPVPTAAQLAQVASYANYQAAAATYLAQTGATYWVTFADWQQSVINQSYMGVAGPVGYDPASPFYNAAQAASAISVSQSADGKTINLSANLPGDLTMCGGFYSPLMVFFDQERPRFENVTDFKMKHDQKTYWPEKNHAGYFLGLLNANDKIESHKDLFGESENSANGFESLSVYDLNKDGVIDAKDPVFKKLVLWKDKSGLGKFDKKDIIYASKKIKSIQLKYKNNFEMVSIGAEYRQRSSFEFVKNGKVKSGEIVDVWFKPYLNLQKQMASK